jgi:hypothetical protein
LEGLQESLDPIGAIRLLTQVSEFLFGLYATVFTQGFYVDTAVSGARVDTIHIVLRSKALPAAVPAAATSTFLSLPDTIGSLAA